MDSLCNLEFIGTFAVIDLEFVIKFDKLLKSLIVLKPKIGN